MNLRKASILKGIEPPQEVALCFCECHKAQPTVYESQLANRPHREPEIRKIQKDFFTSLMQIITEIEEQWLMVLGLPGIDTVRQKFLSMKVIKQDDPFEYTPEQSTELDRLFREWRDAVAGGNDSAYEQYQLLAFAAGAKISLDRILALIPEAERDQALISQATISLNNAYLQGIVTDGRNRVTSKITVEFREKAQQILINGMRDGLSVTEIAQKLHREIGEGSAWHWLRFAKSEIVLASEAAYDAQTDALGVPYDVWSAAPTACFICAPLDSQVWKRGEGPVPVSDTHPYCQCERLPLFETDKPIHRPWERGTPYGPGNGFVPGEVEAWL